MSLFELLFYPFIAGSYGGPVGLHFEFLFEPAEQYAPPYFPRDWLAPLSDIASFGGENVDGLQMVRDHPNGALSQRAAHQRFGHRSGFPVGERLRLLEWYLERLNRLLFELTDLANFTDDSNAIDPVFGFEHYFTVDRLFRKIALTMSLAEPAAGKLMVFEVADLFDTLSGIFRNQSSTEFFKTLFHPVNGLAAVNASLRLLPEPFASYFTQLARETYEGIEKAIIASVWLKPKVTPNAILVRNRNLTDENVVANADFVAEVMRAYRNANHGYFTRRDAAGNRPSRYLYLVDGNLPVDMSLLPVLWWLAYLADPDFVGWNHFPVGVFD